MNVEDLMVGDWVLLYKNGTLTPTQVTLDLMCNEIKNMCPIFIDDAIMAYNGFEKDKEGYILQKDCFTYKVGVRIYAKTRTSSLTQFYTPMIVYVHTLQHLLKLSCFSDKKVLMPTNYPSTVEQYKQIKNETDRK